MPKNLQPQREQIKPEQANYGEYSRLAEQFLKKPNKPIYSAGQGIAEVLGDVGEAYFLKKAAEKERAGQEKDLTDMAMAQQFVTNPNTSRVQSQDALGVDRTIANSVFDRPANANERFAGGMAQMQGNPRAQLAGAPDIMEMAKQFEPEPKFQDVELPGGAMGQRDPRTNQLTVPFTPAAPRESEPLVEVADPNDPTRGVMVPRSQAAGRATVQTVRDRMPRVKTYYDEEGNPLTLDANDPVDQATIKERSLVESAPTEAERVSKGFLDRMTAAEPNMQAVVDQGYDPSNFRDKKLQGVPLGNYMVSDQGQLYRQAQEDWVRAKLRKESGAVIGDDEMEREIKTYFPQPGDTPAVQAQKAISRKGAERQLATTAGLLGRKYLRGDTEKKAPAASQEGVPDGIDANVWKFMTPEERALWSK